MAARHLPPRMEPWTPESAVGERLGPTLGDGDDDESSTAILSKQSLSSA
jgi:hypothetical protein